MNHGIRFVDESDSGIGPYWTLAKETSGGSLNRAKGIEFFDIMLTRLRTTHNTALDQVTALDLYNLYSEYLKTMQKRKIVLKKVNQVTRRDIQDLVDFLANKE